MVRDGRAGQGTPSMNIRWGELIALYLAGAWVAASQLVIWGCVHGSMPVAIIGGWGTGYALWRAGEAFCAMTDQWWAGRQAPGKDGGKP